MRSVPSRNALIHPVRQGSSSSRDFCPTREKDPQVKAGVVGQKTRLGWYDWIDAAAPLTKISQLELSSLVDEEVLGLQVPVENFPLVTVRQTS